MNPLVPFSLKQAVIDFLTGELPNLGAGNFPVHNAYPASPNLLPCVAVQQASGGEEKEVIGQRFQGVYEDDTGNQLDLEGSYYRQSVEVSLWSWHSEERDELAPKLRTALFRLRKILSDDEDLHEIHFTEDGDGQDFDKDEPQDVYLFTFHFSALVPLIDATPLEPAESITVTAYFEPTEDE